MKNEISRERYAAGEERVRTYNEKFNRVTDGRISDKIFTYTSVLKGSGFEDIIDLLQGDVNESNQKERP
jgi:protein subunit release factor A